MTHLDNPNIYLVDAVQNMLGVVDGDFIVAEEYAILECFNEDVFIKYLNNL